MVVNTTDKQFNESHFISFFFSFLRIWIVCVFTNVGQVNIKLVLERNNVSLMVSGLAQLMKFPNFTSKVQKSNLPKIVWIVVRKLHWINLCTLNVTYCDKLWSLVISLDLLRQFFSLICQHVFLYYFFHLRSGLLRFKRRVICWWYLRSNFRLCPKPSRIVWDIYFQ